MTTEIRYAWVERIFADAHIVGVRTADNRVLYHNGPVVEEFFTFVQADDLVKRISLAGKIDEVHWNNGSYYHDDEEREYQMMQDKLDESGMFRAWPWDTNGDYEYSDEEMNRPCDYVLPDLI